MENHTLVDIRIPFWRLVVIFVKWAIAAIPATIIIVVLYTLVIGVVWGALGLLTGGAFQIPRPF